MALETYRQAKELELLATGDPPEVYVDLDFLSKMKKELSFIRVISDDLVIWNDVRYKAVP